MTQTTKPPKKHASNQTNHNEDADKDPLSLNAEQLLDWLFQVIQKLWLQGRRFLYAILSELGKNELVQAVAAWCLQHPDMALCLLAAGFVLLLPFLIIFGFGIITIAVTFAGILMLEGTVLTVFLMIFLACIGSLAIGVTVFAVIAYFGLAQIYNFFGMDRHKDVFIKFVQQNRYTDSANESPQHAI